MPVRPITIYSSQPLAKRNIGIVYVDDAYKQFKKFCDNLRCPLCGAQLDGNIHNKKADLYCASNNKEYKGIWFPNEEEPSYEFFKFWYYPYEYEIAYRQISSGNFHMLVDRYDMDTSQIHKNSTRVELFSHTGPRILAFRQRMEEGQFLKKLKTVKVFS